MTCGLIATTARRATVLVRVLAGLLPSIVLAAAEAFPVLSETNAPTVAAYAPEAFPAARRAQDVARLQETLAQARSRGPWLDVRLRTAFASRPPEHVGRIRVSKRRLLRERALRFAVRSLARGDATGLGFAERALKDAEALDAFLAEEIELLAKEPSEANGAVVLNVRDYGATGDGVADDAPAFSRALDAVRRLGGRPSVLKIPAGVYRMASVQRCAPITDAQGEYCDAGAVLSDQCLFANLANCRIEGAAADKTFIRCALYEKAQLALVNCRNVTLANLDLSLEETPFLQGVVTAFDAESRSCEIDLKPGTRTPAQPGWRGLSHGSLFGPDGQMILPNGRLLAWNPLCPEGKSEDLGGGRWRLRFSPKADPWGWSWKNQIQNIRPGQTLVIPDRVNGLGAVSVRFCSFCTLDNVWVRNSRAWAFATWRSRSTTFVRCRDVPRDGLILASNADGCWCEAGTVFLDCVFDTMGDDGINSLTYGRITERSESPYEVYTPDYGLRPGGDLAVFAAPDTAQYLGNLRIAQTDALVWRKGGWWRVTRFVDKVPDRFIGAFLYDPARDGIGTVVSGCTFRNGRLAGNVVQTSTALYENNVYVNLLEGIRLGALGDCKEGPPPYNVLVRGCRFERTVVGLTGWFRMHTKEKGWTRNFACAPLRGIDVYDNTFVDIPDVAVSFRNAGDCRFAGNTFERATRCWRFETCEDMTDVSATMEKAVKGE